jgi:hypothetical protein
MGGLSWDKGKKDEKAGNLEVWLGCPQEKA